MTSNARCLCLKVFKVHFFPKRASIVKLLANPEVTSGVPQILYLESMASLMICHYPAERFMVPDRTFLVVSLADKRKDHTEGHFLLCF